MDLPTPEMPRISFSLLVKPHPEEPDYTHMETTGPQGLLLLPRVDRPCPGLAPADPVAPLYLNLRTCLAT